MARCLNPVKHRHHHTRPWAVGGISLAILALVGGCSGLPNGGVPPPNAGANGSAEALVQPLAPLPSPATALVTASRQVQARARRVAVPADPVAVDLYTLDSTCEAYQIEPIQVPRPQSMETTVGLILAEQAIPELTLSGYRASYDLERQTATIDLRVARTSRRGLRSLSMCEQRALLGSLRETLVNQPDWKIDAVVFTNRGIPLAR